MELLHLLEGHQEFLDKNLKAQYRHKLDDYLVFQYIYPNLIFSLRSALFIHKLITLDKLSSILYGLEVTSIKGSTISTLKFFKEVTFHVIQSKEEYELGHIPSSINIPLDELRDNLSKLDKNKEIVLICQSALRSYIGCRILSNLNYNTSHLAGGYRIYSMIKHDQGLTN